MRRAVELLGLALVVAVNLVLFILVFPGILAWIAGENAISWINDQIVLDDDAGRPWHGLWKTHTSRGALVKVAGRFGLVRRRDYERFADSVPRVEHLPTKAAYRDSVRRFDF